MRRKVVGFPAERSPPPGEIINQLLYREEEDVRIRLVFALLILSAAVGLTPAQASSHREAPGITKMPKVDGTDLYMFNSYESGRSGYVTLIADYQPFQPPCGGPNYFFLDPDALYRIHIDNTGDGVEDITFQFRVAPRLVDIKLPVGGQSVSVPLYNVGPFQNDAPGARSPNLNIVESFTMWVIRGKVGGGAHPGGNGFATSPSGGSRFAKPADNVGQKSVADYEDYAANFIQEFRFPGCQNGNAIGRVFLGQRKEPFAVNVGEIFDLINLNPIGARNGEPNPLDRLQHHHDRARGPQGVPDAERQPTRSSAAGRRPRCRATASLTQNPTFKNPTNSSGDFVQVSRLGMPLVNEVVIGLKDKDLFNAASPKGDAALATYITNPTLPAIIQVLFGSAGVLAPTNFPRRDLVAAFATGIQGLNFLSDGQPHEMHAPQHVDRGQARRAAEQPRRARRRHRRLPQRPPARATTSPTSSCGWPWACSATPSRASTATPRTLPRAPSPTPTRCSRTPASSTAPSPTCGRRFRARRTVPTG